MALIIEKSVLSRGLRLKLALTTIITSASTNILWIYLILYAKSIGASEVETSAITSASSLLLMTSPFWGHLSDKYGYDRVVSLGQLLVLLSSLMVLLSPNIKVLMLSRAVTGLGLAMFIPSMLSLMSSSRSRRSLHVSIYSASQSTGWAIGLVVGGFVAKEYSLIHSFYLSFVLASIAVLTFRFTIKRALSPAQRRQSLGTLHFPWSKSFVMLSIASFFRDGSIIGAYSFLPVFLRELGASEDQVGLILAVNTIPQILLMLLVGKLSEFINEEAIFLAGITGTSIVVFSYSIANSVIDVIPIQLLLALSFSSFYVSSRSIAGKLAPKNIGAALGTLTLCRNAGGTLMPLLAGIVWNLYGARVAFRFLSLICVIGLLVAILFVTFMRSHALSNRFDYNQEVMNS